jgi:hypothetical protein
LKIENLESVAGATVARQVDGLMIQAGSYTLGSWKPRVDPA